MNDTIAQLRKELEVRNYSHRTVKTYTQAAKQFGKYYKKDIRNAGIDDVKGYLHHLTKVRELKPSSVNQAAYALRYLFLQVLEKKWDVKKIPRPRGEKKLPEVLSGSEVHRLIDSFDSIKHKTIACVCYGAGLRISEALSLYIEDIDSKRNVIRVYQGKGKKDRQVNLSPSLLQQLREYARQERPQGKYLFTGMSNKHPMNPKSFSKKLQIAAKMAGIQKHVTAHVLRHSYATHMLEAGADLRTVQVLLGHSSIEATTRYLHITHTRMKVLKYPLDIIGKPEGWILG